MSFDDMFRAIRCGDNRVAAAFALECTIMSTVPLILIGAWLAR